MQETRRRREYQLQQEAVVGTLMGLIDVCKENGLDHIPFSDVEFLIVSTINTTYDEFIKGRSEEQQ